MFPKSKKRSARMRLDAFGICLLKQKASGARRVASPSKIETFREFEADLSALFYTVYDNLLQDFVYMTVSIDIDDFFNIRCRILRNTEIGASI